MGDKLGLRINLHWGFTVLAEGTYPDEDDAIETMIHYGTKGYYSRTLKEYFPPSSIKSIDLVSPSKSRR